MPTFRGWLVAAIGVGIALAGRALAAPQMEMLGIGILALPLCAWIEIRRRGHDVRVDRSVTPALAHAGHPVTIGLEINNDGRARTPLLLLEDRLPWELAGRARFAVQGIEPRGVRTTEVTVRPRRRGRYKVGPVEISVLDPFGLVRRSFTATNVSDFLVYPRIEPLAMPRDRGEQRSLAVSALRQPTGARGEDFYTLREYVDGDDLRKVHWPATARTEKVMIRQEETPWHTRATVLLDDRDSAHSKSGASFDRAVEVAASVCDLYNKAGYSYRFAAAKEPGFPAARGNDHFHRCLELLATMAPAPTGRDTDPLLVRLAELESGASAEGTLVVVSGDLSPAEAALIGRCRRRFRQIVVVMLPSHRFGTSATRERWDGERSAREIVTLLARSGARCLLLGEDESLAAVWASLSGRAAVGNEERWDLKPELA